MKMLVLSLMMLFSRPMEQYIGVWNTNKDETLIEIYKTNDTYFGKIISSKNPKAKQGTLILQNFTLQDGKLKGQFYSIKLDKLFDAEMQFQENKIELTIFTNNRSKTILLKKETQI